MHEEWFEIPFQVAERINLALREGRKVLAVGTTSMRALESAWNRGQVRHGNFPQEFLSIQVMNSM